MKFKGIKILNIADMKLHLINIVNFKSDGGAMFGVIPKALWSRAYPADEMNLVTLALRSLVVETGKSLILIDTGWGSKQDERFFRHSYLHGGEGLIKGLFKHGYRPEDITDVFHTHLHADHCGGTIERGGENNNYRPVFPNAVSHVSKVQWEWAVKNNIREEDAYPPENILPMKDSGRLNLIEQEQELFPGFSFRICHGHTPGLMIPVIRYSEKTIIFAGDLIPTSAHIPLIWNMSYDIESLKTIDEKNAVLTEALEPDHFLVFQHDAKVECCNVALTEKGIRVKERLPFSSIL